MFMHAARRPDHPCAVPGRRACRAADLIAGQIDGVVDNPPTVISHIESGKLRPLAVRRAVAHDASARRADRGRRRASPITRRRPGSASPRRPARRPPIVARLHKEIAAALRAPAMQERFAKSGAHLVGNTPEAVRRADPRRVRRPGARSSRRRASKRSRCTGLRPAPWR